MADVGMMIRRARTEAGLSQKELAVRAGTSQPALTRYETGETLPGVATLERLLSACGMRLDLRVVRAPTQAHNPVSSVRARLGPKARRLRRRRRLLLDAATRHGVRRMRVFGSLARDEELAQSDIDLLVELAPGRTLLDLAGFRREAHEILGVPVDVATLDMLKPRMRAEVLAQALPL